VATKQSDTESSYVIYTTDGVAERVYVDQNQDSSYNVTETAATARFDQFSNTLYMSIDVACETQTNNIEPCLEKGDLIFITDANWGQDLNTQQNKAFFGADTVVDFAAGYADTTDLYTITKIWTAEETADTAVMCTAAKSSEWSCTVGDLYSGSYENKFRITVDKSINWDGSTLANPSTDSSVTTDSVYGYVQLLKFTPASTATTSTSPCARTAASATVTTASASASRATPTTTATRSRRSPSKAPMSDEIARTAQETTKIVALAKLFKGGNCGINSASLV